MDFTAPAAIGVIVGPSLAPSAIALNSSGGTVSQGRPSPALPPEQPVSERTAAASTATGVTNLGMSPIMPRVGKHAWQIDVMTSRIWALITAVTGGLILILVIALGTIYGTWLDQVGELLVAPPVELLFVVCALALLLLIGGLIAAATSPRA